MVEKMLEDGTAQGDVNEATTDLATKHAATVTAKAASTAAWARVTVTTADYEAELVTRAQAALADAGPKSSLRVSLAETDHFRYGKAVRVGDNIALQVGPGVVVQDVLKEATFTWSSDSGADITLTAGEWTDDPDALLANAVQTLARRMTKQEANR